MKILPVDFCSVVLTFSSSKSSQISVTKQRLIWKNTCWKISFCKNTLWKIPLRKHTHWKNALWKNTLWKIHFGKMHFVKVHMGKICKNTRWKNTLCKYRLQSESCFIKYMTSHDKPMLRALASLEGYMPVTRHQFFGEIF